MCTDFTPEPRNQTTPWISLHAAVNPPAAGTAARLLQMQVLDILDFGVLLVDAQCRVVHANSVAQVMCAADTTLSLADGQLQVNAADQRRLDQAVLATLRGQWSMLTLPRRGTPLSVAVVPLPGAASASGAVAALMIGGNGRPSRLALQFFKQNHGLTGAEAAVLDALCDGLQPAQIADAGGVAVCTVRSQISAIRAKVGARSIGHLLRMLGGLPPVARHVPTAVT